MNNEIATLGAGCFWCVEEIFKELKGVKSVVSGYSGGKSAAPTYEEVSSGTTNHAEVIQVTFDPTLIDFKQILGVFWRVHDPTTLNKQGADVGTQYRSVIFYHSPLQKEIALNLKEELERIKIFNNPIVTEISPFETFYIAEDYHQNYYRNNPNQLYCRIVIDPKISKFRKEFIDKLI